MSKQYIHNGHTMLGVRATSPGTVQDYSQNRPLDYSDTDQTILYRYLSKQILERYIIYPNGEVPLCTVTGFSFLKRTKRPQFEYRDA